MLAIEHLSVDYFRRGRVIPAVRDFSMILNAGETVGLVGESGSGKSTIALAILRLIRPQEGKITQGHIRFGDKDLLEIAKEEMRQVRGAKISMIFQDPFTSLNPVMTIREQLQEVLVAHNVQSSMEDALAQVQLDPARILHSYSHQLSGGQRQRVMIAMALMTRPEIVLADEPTTALDVLVQKEILDLLSRLQKDIGFGLLLISHNLGVIGERAQRILVMKEGRLVEEGTAKTLFAHAKEPYTRELTAAFMKVL